MRTLNPATKSVGFGGKRGEREGRELLRPKEREGKEGGREAKGSREELEKQRETMERLGRSKGPGFGGARCPRAALELQHSRS